MAIGIQVTRGHTFQPGVPFSIDDMNAAALPTVEIVGVLNIGDLGAFDASTSQPDGYWYAPDVGDTLEAYIAVPDPAATDLVDGLIVSVLIRSGATNTTTSPTLDVSELGAKPIKRRGGASVFPGDLRAGYIHVFVYNTASTGHWELLNPAEPAQRYGANNSSTTAALAITTTPAMAALYTGARIAFKSPVAADAAATLAVDGLTAKPIYTVLGAAIPAGAIASGQQVELIYDATLNTGSGAWVHWSSPGQTLPVLGTAFQVVRTNAAASARENANPVVLQVVRATKADSFGVTAVKAIDNSAWSSAADMDKFLSVAFTPLSASSKIMVEFDCQAHSRDTVDSAELLCALWRANYSGGGFVDGNAIQVSNQYMFDGRPYGIRLVHLMDSWGTSEQALNIGFAVDDAAVSAVYINELRDSAGTPLNFGGLVAATMRITEYLP